jgi:hypothetical protein
MTNQRNRRSTTLRLVALAVLTLLGFGYSAAAAAQEDNRKLQVYSVRFLHPNNAAALAFQVCGGGDRCEVESLGDQGLVLRADAEIHAQYAALLAERDVPPPTQAFRVILLRADRDGSMPEVPADALAALEDLRQVMPYGGFTVIDSGWLRTSSAGSTSLGEAGSFGVQLVFSGDPRQSDALLVEAFELSHSQVYWENLDDPGSIPRAHLGDTTHVLSSQFGINVGETVVVGTSRMNGDGEALVVLLTALER